MKITPICPECGTPAVGVDYKVARHFSKTALAMNKRWAACVNATCTIAYFCTRQILRTSELTQILWYKDKRGQAPICYCSQLTRKEIVRAVSQGAKTIHDVQRMTKKNRTGFCTTENPLGFCCRDAFLREIRDATKKRNSEPAGGAYVAPEAGAPSAHP